MNPESPEIVALRAAVAALPPEGGEVYLPPGIYIVDGPISFDKPGGRVIQSSPRECPESDKP